MDYLAQTPEQLGQILRRCRAQREMTQAQTGARVGLKQATVSAIEANAARTSVESLYKLLSSLGLELVLRDKSAKASSATAKREW